MGANAVRPQDEQYRPGAWPQLGDGSDGWSVQLQSEGGVQEEVHRATYAALTAMGFAVSHPADVGEDWYLGTAHDFGLMRNNRVNGRDGGPMEWNSMRETLPTLVRVLGGAIRWDVTFVSIRDACRRHRVAEAAEAGRAAIGSAVDGTLGGAVGDDEARFHWIVIGDCSESDFSGGRYADRPDLHENEALIGESRTCLLLVDRLLREVQYWIRAGARPAPARARGRGASLQCDGRHPDAGSLRKVGSPALGRQLDRQHGVPVRLEAGAGRRPTGRPTDQAAPYLRGRPGGNRVPPRRIQRPGPSRS